MNRRQFLTSASGAAALSLLPVPSPAQPPAAALSIGNIQPTFLLEIRAAEKPIMILNPSGFVEVFGEVEKAAEIFWGGVMQGYPASAQKPHCVWFDYSSKRMFEIKWSETGCTAEGLGLYGPDADKFLRALEAKCPFVIRPAPEKAKSAEVSAEEEERVGSPLLSPVLTTSPALAF